MTNLRTMKRASLLAFAAIMAASGSASADDASLARAQSLFDEGKAQFDAENYAAACPKLEESKSLDAGLGVTLYSAACEDALGKHATALALYREAEAMAHARGDSREEVAHQYASELENKTARIRIHPPKGAERVMVSDNGTFVSIESSRGFAVDPGTHKIAVTSSSSQEWSETVNVPPSSGANGPIIDVTVGAEHAAAAGAKPSAAPVHPDADQPPSRRSGMQRGIGVGIGAAGLVAMGVGTYFGLHAISLKGDSNDPGGGCNAADQCNAHGMRLRSDAMSSATASTVLFALGGAAVVAGVVLFVAVPSSHADVAVAIGPTGASLGGRF